MERDEDFIAFAAARWSTLYRLAYLLTVSAAAAEDLLQTSLEKAYVAWPRISTMDAPDAYVRKLMVNALVSDRRRKGARAEVLRDRLPEESTASPERGVLDHVQLWPLVCALPARQRAVIVLRYYEDLTERETADVLGCSVGTVKSQCWDAMRALRRAMTAASELEGTAP